MTKNNLKINAESIRTELNRIVSSPAIGRSENYKELLIYLVECELKNIDQESTLNTPKEFEIATSVFINKQNYSPGEDSFVRVYVSNLRKKLRDYYKNLSTPAPFQIEIPKGSYKVEFTTTHLEPGTRENKSSKVQIALYPLAAAVAILFSANLWQFLKAPTAEDIEPSAVSRVSNHTVWHRFNHNDKPILVVMGDLFVFSEFDKQLNRYRTIRDTSINTQAEFNEFLRNNPSYAEKVKENRANILTKGNVITMREFLPIFNSDKTVSFRLMSNVTASDLRDYNILFIGLFKSLGALKNYLQGSNFIVHQHSITYKKTEKNYRIVGDYKKEYTDYGIFASFSGPSGNDIKIVSAFSDTAIVQIGKIMSSTAGLEKLETAAKQGVVDLNGNFEVLIEASGYDRTDLASDILLTDTINKEAVWAKPNIQ
ncbi:hypothetical protein [Catenovulum adriaticum]|uniref:Uncharacterized protein n=1 Tax=Catenovulum adriaticum TaxID=2984846 RepID=A0ABY7AQR7_9ALTE|nr:hypothetical protein [Catenovulum sp. TS8]WAJ71893.1 hypothetical protein OLW01_14285 [Catenovulum sp. TS8]